jgi:hypothetical protein
VDSFAREAVIEQPQEVIGEALPLIVLGHHPPRRPAMAACVVPQQSSSTKPSTEVEVEHPIVCAA